MAWATGSSPGSDILAATAIKRWQLTIGDRDTSFLMHPTIRAGWMDESDFLQAVAEEVPVIGLGLDMLAPEVESAEANELTPSGTSYTLTPARKAGKMTVSGLYRIEDGMVLANYDVLAFAMFLGGQRRLMADIAALFPSITNIVGSTGVTLSWSVLKSAVDTNFAAGSRGQQVALLADKQWREVSNDALTLGGAIEHQPEMQGFMGGSRGFSFKGVYLNGDLVVYAADDNIITDDGTDYSGAVFGPEAFGIKTRAPQPDPAAQEVARMGWMMAELERNASIDDTEVVVTGYTAAAIAQNTAACEVLSVK